MKEKYKLQDIFIIGGGINGCGIAHDAARRGLKVTLCEMNDLASATSSASSKLIHGGLRYLEHGEFRLVKKALAERETLLKNAPHIIRPLTFNLPHRQHLRPAWMIKAGLFLYDNLSKRVTLAPSKQITFTKNSDLDSQITKGFRYSDAWVDDARLTVLNALAAKEQGATIKTQSKCVAFNRFDDHWQIQIKNKKTNEQETIYSKCLINAAGPWVNELQKIIGNQTDNFTIRLVKGSHIVVPKFCQSDDAYILQNEDQRIVFILPFENDFNLIGTTDIDYSEPLDDISIDNSEIDYLLDITNSYFKHQIKKTDITYSFSGVRPLLSDESANAQQVTRDYTFDLNASLTQAPLITVYGGKITTYRRLAQACIDKLSPYFEHLPKSSTKSAPLPGGDFTNLFTLEANIHRQFPWLPSITLQRWLKSYGSYSERIIHQCQSLDNMGIHFGHGLYQIEVDYLRQNEWGETLEDILWRRSKLGLLFNEQQTQMLTHYLNQ